MEGKNDGFKFAITALTGLLTFLLYITKYFQDNVVNPDLKWFYHVSFNYIIISSILFILYIILKGLTMEVQAIHKKTLEVAAAVLYIFAFYITTLSVINSFLVMYLNPLNNEHIFKIYMYIVILIVLAVAVYFTKILSTKLSITKYSLLLKKRGDLIYHQHNNWLVSKYDTWIVPIIPKIPDLIFIYFILIIFGMTATLGILLNPPANWIKGDIIIDTKDMYYKNDTLVPVSIKVTGMNANLSINLLRVNPKYNPILMDYIILEPKYNITKAVISGNNSILIGNSLNYGKYIIFINTTNLTIGYYELVGLRYTDEKYIKSFYLLNNTKT